MGHILRAPTLVRHLALLQLRNQVFAKLSLRWIIADVSEREVELLCVVFNLWPA